jgi:hypothetical protein
MNELRHGTRQAEREALKAERDELKSIAQFDALGVQIMDNGLQRVVREGQPGRPGRRCPR